jgi:hypothetical protein
MAAPSARFRFHCGRRGPAAAGCAHPNPFAHARSGSPSIAPVRADAAGRLIPAHM